MAHLEYPQLSSWVTSSSRRLRPASVAALGAMLVSMWYLVIKKLWIALAGDTAHTRIVPWFLDEISNWVLFLLLAHLFSLSLPRWAKDLLLPVRGRDARSGQG